MGRVLILDGRQRSTLAATRSLGRAGHQVTVGEDVHPCLASSSKFCAAKFTHRSVTKTPARFVEDLLAELKRQSYDLLLPMTDITTMLVRKEIDRISELTKLTLPAPADYDRAIDKGELVKLCLEIGVPVPKTLFIKSTDELESLKGDLIFPVVVKPRQSKYLIDDHWVETSVSYAVDFEALEAKLTEWDARLPYPMIQERIQGAGEGAFLLFNQGKVKAAFFHRRLREKPPSGGVSTLRESAEPNKLMQDYSRRLLERLNWHGVAMVEFKYDNRDSLPKVMEINARFWGSLQLGIDAGIDFPRLLFELATNQDSAEIVEYKTNVRSRWLWGDFDSLLIRLTKPAKQLNLPDNAPTRGRLLWEFIKFVQPNTKYEILKLSDIGPFLNETKEWFRLLRK
jgi:predicted ATP-grasp superfamily ATP-dependent carboligase